LNVHELIAEVALRVPQDAPVGTRYRVSGQVTTDQGLHTVEIAARIDARSRRHEQHFCDGVRVPREVLLRLTCAETECTHAQQVRAQWNAFHGRRPAAASPSSGEAPAPAPLMRETPLAVAGHQCVARPATFRCFTPCPNHAHPALWIEKSGFDLFEDGACVGGGVVVIDGTRRPRLPSLRAAEAYLFARHLEAMVTLDAAATGGGPLST